MSHEKTKKITVRSLCACAMLSAAAFVLQLLEFAIPVMPGFIKFDISDIPALLGSFVLGPLYGVVIQFIKNLIHIPFGSSMAVGELCNFLLGAIFAFSAGMIYKYKRTKSGAIIGCVVGAVLMSVVSIPINYFFVYPAYVVIYKMPLDVIIDMYTEIFPKASAVPTSNALLNCLIIFNLPFTFVKGIIDSIICHIIYKPISRLYHK